MIDLHSHVLFGCDDGSKTMEQSISMLKEAARVGITAVFTTPHYMEDGYQNKKEVLYTKTEQLQKAIQNEKMDIHLYNGEEIYIFPSLGQELESGRILSLNNSRYFLVELPLWEKVDYIDDVIYAVMSMGYIPILAHPERYLWADSDLHFVENWVNKGGLLQVNANSFIGRYGKRQQKVAKELLQKGWVHFIASDAHTADGYNRLEQSLKKIQKLAGEEYFHEITIENQQCVIENREIKKKVYNQQTRHFYALEMFLKIFRK